MARAVRHGVRARVAQRVDAHQLARPRALGPAFVVAGACVRVPLAGVDDDEPPAPQPQWHGLDLERAEVDPQRRIGRSVEGCQLVEHPCLGADPVVLDARAQACDRDPVERLATSGAQPRLRRRPRPAAPPDGGASRRVCRARHRATSSAAEEDRPAPCSRSPPISRRAPTERNAGSLQLGGRAPHERAPALRWGDIDELELVHLVEVARVGVDALRRRASRGRPSPHAR